MKVRINGEYFEYDRERRPMTEMLALEKALKTTYVQWESDLRAGSARALAGLIWLTWRRNGRDVPFDDIESGVVDIDLAEVSFESDDAPPDPTTGPGEKEALPTTGRATSGRSPKS